MHCPFCGGALAPYAIALSGQLGRFTIEAKCPDCFDSEKYPATEVEVRMKLYTQPEYDALKAARAKEDEGRAERLVVKAKSNQ